MYKNIVAIYHCLNTSIKMHYISINNLRGNKVQLLLKLPVYAITLILILSISSLQMETFAQSNMRIFDVPGGSGGSTSQTEDSNDNTAIYVVAGLVIGGILLYALVFKPAKKVESDTTASLNSHLIYSEANGFNSTNEELQKVKDKIPVDFFLGIKNNEALMNDKTYLLGLRVKL